MTTERIDKATPHGGDYMVATYVRLTTLEEVDRADADGIVIAEYTTDGKLLMETVGSYEGGVTVSN